MKYVNALSCFSTLFHTALWFSCTSVLYSIHAHMSVYRDMRQLTHDDGSLTLHPSLGSLCTSTKATETTHIHNGSNTSQIHQTFLLWLEKHTKGIFHWVADYSPDSHCTLRKLLLHLMNIIHSNMHADMSAQMNTDEPRWSWDCKIRP